VENYQNWYVLGYLGSIAAFSAVSMCLSDQSNAVWTTNEACLGDSKFPVAIGVPLALLLQTANFIMTGIGEEALYRGVYYEEMAYRFGKWPAKFSDDLFFSLSHMPQNYEAYLKISPQEICLDLLSTMLQTLWFQYIYEWGGLEQSVTAHAGANIILFFTNWLIQGGVPNSRGFSSNKEVL